MKAITYQGVLQVAYEEVEKPTVGEKECLVRVAQAGICGSDVTAYTAGGQYVGVDVGSVFGHEFVGYVDQVGPGVEGVQPGDRVWVNPCRSVADPRLSDMAGGFAEYALVCNAALGDALWKLPDDLSFDLAAIIEPFCVATHGKNQARCTPQDNVVVYGAGTIGMLALCSLIAQGNQKVVVVDRSPHRLELAKSFGAIPFNTDTDGDLTPFLQKVFGPADSHGRPCANIDAVIDCIGVPSLFTKFTDCAKPGTRYAVVAVYKQPAALPMTEVMSKELQIIGSRSYQNEDIREVIDNLTHRRPQGMEKIITHTFPLSEATKAFDTASDREAAMKVVFQVE